MKTQLDPEFQGTPEGEAAEAVLRKCVHCGFCNATCPTYQLLGDELDGPRGRIYLIKRALEGGEVTRSTQLHLDRCLTCLSCETTCPSGVEYGRLLDIGRKIVDERVARPAPARAARWLLREGLTSSLFAPAMRLGRMLRPLLPRVLKDKVPAHAAGKAHPAPQAAHTRRVLLPIGCVQPAMRPNIDRATLRVLDAVGIEAVRVAGAGCCGALRQHLSDPEGALENMRRNIDAWWPLIEAGQIEAIVVNASACSLMIKDYAAALAGDPDYVPKALRVAALARDLSELLPEIAPKLRDEIRIDARRPIAVHAPCTLQHGQRLRGAVEPHLAHLGFDLLPTPGESHACCGSAGTYSVLQPELARQLRDRRLGFLSAGGAACIVSGNIGCIQHLQSGTDVPVRHWVELLDEALPR